MGSELTAITKSPRGRHQERGQRSGERKSTVEGATDMQNLHGQRDRSGVPAVWPPDLLRAVRPRTQRLPPLPPAHPRHCKDLHVLKTERNEERKEVSPLFCSVHES